jgi:hypothetical protein
LSVNAEFDKRDLILDSVRPKDLPERRQMATISA